MRSDMLGFSTPIVQREGCYSYGERDYSIFKVSIRDAELLERVLRFILELRSEVNHPDMDEIIEHILEAIPGREDLRQGIFPEKPSPEQPLLTQKAGEPGDEDEFFEDAEDVFSISGADQAVLIQESVRYPGISWSMILELI